MHNIWYYTHICETTKIHKTQLWTHFVPSVSNIVHQQLNAKSILCDPWFQGTMCFIISQELDFWSIPPIHLRSYISKIMRNSLSTQFLYNFTGVSRNLVALLKSHGSPFNIVWANGHTEIKWHFPDGKVRMANMGPTWVLAVLGGPRVGPMYIAVRVVLFVRF